MTEIRFHGRGGQGARVASRIVGRAGFLAGLFAQDLSLFGAERRGAPIVAFTRLSRQLIDRRGYVESPDAVMIMDDSLLEEARDQIFQGLQERTPVIVNSRETGIALPEAGPPQGNWLPLDLSAIARRVIGRPTLSAIAAACAAKLVPELTGDILSEAVRIELGEAGLPPQTIEKNILAAKEAFDQMPALAVPERAVTRAGRAEPAKLFPLPYDSSRGAAATILHPGSSALRHTGEWRTETPEILLDKCKRCFLCFLFCPEAAVALDQQNYPHIDYEHCKGCMICHQECPPEAIVRRAAEEADAA